ncbi:hypothetical protein F5Y14DRAFT_274891 [Nemania sp. NC0429]|nr:hypothetical protein F5Y14DRAFT_274891 [Nemania sp. NC0429]
MRSSILTATAALAATAIASPIVERTVYYNWPATNVQSDVAHILIGAKFDLDAPAGYVAGAPAFSVTCHANLIDPAGRVACVPKGTLAAGSKVEADYWDGQHGTLTVWHTYGSHTASGVITLSGYNQDFVIPVTSVV